jgi:aspartokinase
MDKIKIGGMRLSHERLQFMAAEPAKAPNTPLAFFDRLAGLKINLPLLCMASDTREFRTVFCLKAEEALCSQNLLKWLSKEPWIGKSGSKVGTVTLFPHRFQPELMGAAIMALESAGLSPLMICTSISAVFINIQLQSIQRAIQAFVSIFELPENHAPFHLLNTPEPQEAPSLKTSPFGEKKGRKTPETAAVYWEREIKTYGIELTNGLALCRIRWPAGQTALLGSVMRLLAGENSNLKMAVVLPGEREDWIVRLLFEKKVAGLLKDMVSKEKDKGLRASMQMEPAALIQFSGPHFQDRYGIAHASLGNLVGRNIPIWAASFAGSSVFLALSETSAQQAVRLLSQNFVGPPDPPKNRRRKHESQN